MRKTLNSKAREAIFDRYDRRCHICGGPITVGQRWDVSHPIPLALGGCDNDTNRKPAHARCHQAVTTLSDIPRIAKAKRQARKHKGAFQTATPLPFGRKSSLSKKINGEIVERLTLGEKLARMRESRRIG